VHERISVENFKIHGCIFKESWKRELGYVITEGNILRPAEIANKLIRNSEEGVGKKQCNNNE
jgi:hypothetical protein